MAKKIDLTISEEAKMQIKAILDQYREKSGMNMDLIPAICWLDAQLNSTVPESQPTIGIYNGRSEIADEIQILSGIEIVLAVPEVVRSLFEHKTLEHKNGRFMLK